MKLANPVPGATLKSWRRLNRTPHPPAPAGAKIATLTIVESDGNCYRRTPAEVRSLIERNRLFHTGCWPAGHLGLNPGQNVEPRRLLALGFTHLTVLFIGANGAWRRVRFDLSTVRVQQG